MEKDRKQYPVTRRTNVSFLITSHLARGMFDNVVPGRTFLFFSFLLCLLLCFVLPYCALCSMEKKLKEGEREG